MGVQPLLGPITLNRQPQPTTYRGQLLQADPAQLGKTQALVAQAKGVVMLLPVDRTEQPGRAGTGRKQLEHGCGIEVRLVLGV